MRNKCKHKGTAQGDSYLDIRPRSPEAELVLGVPRGERGRGERGHTIWGRTIWGERGHTIWEGGKIVCLRSGNAFPRLNPRKSKTIIPARSVACIVCPPFCTRKSKTIIPARSVATLCVPHSVFFSDKCLFDKAVLGCIWILLRYALYMKAIIEQLVHESFVRRIPEGVRRDIRILQMPGKASVLVGMRRTGKTWLCFQQMRDLLAKGIPRERMLYINFEDDRLSGLQTADLQWVVDRYYAANPNFKDQTCWFFFDEIQCVDGWERFVRRILDTEKAEVTLTGSSAKLLSKEIGTAMRGRALVTEVFPLRFAEYCRFHERELPVRPVYGAKLRLELASAARDYLLTGGFPEVQDQDAEISRTVLQDYADVVILRDVIERHGLTNYRAAKALALHILCNPGQLLSVTRLAATLSQSGIACGKNTLFDMLDYFHDAYFCYPVAIHDRSLRRRQVNPRKVYAADPGLCRAFATGQTEDRGFALEGAVFLSLRAGGLEPDYVIAPSGTGVDFVYRDGGGWHFVQCCWSLEHADTRAREIRGLVDARCLHPEATQTIVTFEDEGEEDGIQIMPLWRWLLEL